MRLQLYFLIAATVFASACNSSVPTDALKVGHPASIYPDYYDVTIPNNIAPLNFEIIQSGDKYLTHIHDRYGESLIVSGNVVKIDINKWRKMLAKNVGDTIFADIYVYDNDRWNQYQPIIWAVAEEIDPWVTYRLIEPSYVNFEKMRVCQRHLESFQEDEIYNNCAFADDAQGQCINCHVTQDYNRSGNWQMHVRLYNGGTLIGDSSGVRKVNLKRPETISAGVYPAWHPSLPIIAYSNNATLQTFHNLNRNKVEVQDEESDLVLYDIDSDKICPIANDSTEWETFPAWDPQGNYLYYVSATVPDTSKVELAWYRHDNYKDIKYNIYRRSFDPDTYSFGPADTVYIAADHGASATFPRISPDGRYLLFTQAEYGTFHIWHHDADLYLMDLHTGDVRPLSEANSDDTESYHCWSSNGRWILMSSRRDDGNYTRLYISYFDKEGNAHKPFLLPQESPNSNIWLYKSYNVPELQCLPNSASRKEILNALSQNP